MEPKLTHVFTLRAHVHLGPNATGSQKHIAALEGGIFHGVPNTRGEGMDATLVPGRSDWVLFDPATNVVQIDVRTQGKLSDGSGVSVQYRGYMVVDKKAKQFIGRGPDARSTEFSDHHWWTRPVIETGVQVDGINGIYGPWTMDDVALKMASRWSSIRSLKLACEQMKNEVMRRLND